MAHEYWMLGCGKIGCNKSASRCLDECVERAIQSID